MFFVRHSYDDSLMTRSSPRQRWERQIHGYCSWHVCLTAPLATVSFRGGTGEGNGSQTSTLRRCSSIRVNWNKLLIAVAF